MLGKNMFHAVGFDLVASSVASGSTDYESPWVKVGAVAHGDGRGADEIGFLVDVTSIGTNVAFTIQEAADDGGSAGAAVDTNVTVTVTTTGAVGISDYMPTQPWIRLKAARTGNAAFGSVYSLQRQRELPATHGSDVTVAVGAHGELS